MALARPKSQPPHGPACSEQDVCIILELIWSIFWGPSFHSRQLEGGYKPP